MMAPSLAFRVGVSYPRFRGQANRAIKGFRKGLYDSGLNSNVAERLASDFCEDSRWLSISKIGKMWPFTQKGAK